jgi:hypothetical protein
MLVTPTAELPVGDWVYELKWDQGPVLPLYRSVR